MDKRSFVLSRLHKYLDIFQDCMVKLYELRFRVTRGEYERILLECRLNGHKKLAAYFRNRVMGLGVNMEQKIIENNTILKRLEASLLDKQTKPKYRTVTSRKNIQEPTEIP